jgi:hypothetical protein
MSRFFHDVQTKVLLVSQENNKQKTKYFLAFLILIITIVIAVKMLTQPSEKIQIDILMKPDNCAVKSRNGDSITV